MKKPRKPHFTIFSPLRLAELWQPAKGFHPPPSQLHKPHKKREIFLCSQTDVTPGKCEDTSSKRKTGDLLASVTGWLGDSPFSGSRPLLPRNKQQQHRPPANPNSKSPKLTGLLWKRRNSVKLWRVEEEEKEDLYSGEEEDLSQRRGTGLPASWRHFIVSSTPPKTSRRAKQVKPDPKISHNHGGKVKKNQLLYLPSESGYRTSKSSEKFGSGMTLSDL